MSRDLMSIRARDEGYAREDAQRADARDARAQAAGGYPRLRWWDTTDDTDIPSAELLDGDVVVASIHREALSPRGGFDYAVCVGGVCHSLAPDWTTAKEWAERRHAEVTLRADDSWMDEVPW